jgi:hypothetical protein
MVKISPQISSILISCSQFIGQKYPVRGQGFQNKDTSYQVRTVFKL